MLILSKIRIHLVINKGESLSAAQGEALKSVLLRMFRRRPQLKFGETYKDDPIRKEWLKFLSAVTDGVFNKCDPHQSGSDKLLFFILLLLLLIFCYQQGLIIVHFTVEHLSWLIRFEDCFLQESRTSGNTLTMECKRTFVTRSFFPEL